MENINKGMMDFFQECGQYGHVILIVLPNFFKLHEDYAVARSLFLIDVYADKDYKRGFFNFYNEINKEKLYYFGKRMIGVTAKYAQANPNFWGTFLDWIPLDKTEYENAKKLALVQKKKTRQDKRFRKERDAAIYVAKKYSEMTAEQLAIEMSALSNGKVTGQMVERAVARVTHSNASEDTLEDD
jgi:hypothetical protein